MIQNEGVKVLSGEYQCFEIEIKKGHDICI